MKKILQFKIVLRGVRPIVWRRIQVPSGTTFWDLHVAIQDAMGWSDEHMHEFDLRSGIQRVSEGPRFGVPDEDDPDPQDILPGWEHRVGDHLSLDRPKARYYYDFGDDWDHEVILEAIMPASPGSRYPACLAGENACPPEDVGGPIGYEEFRKILENPKHRQHEEMLEWLGRPFDPSSFDPAEVRFRDPRACLKDLATDFPAGHPVRQAMRTYGRGAGSARAQTRRGSASKHPDPENVIPIEALQLIQTMKPLMSLDPTRFVEGDTILTDEEARTAAEVIMHMYPHDPGTPPDSQDISSCEDAIRFMSVSRCCIRARMARGMTLAGAARILGCPRRQIESIDAGRKPDLSAEVIEKYISLLDLDGWFSRWKEANSDLALRLGLSIGKRS